MKYYKVIYRFPTHERYGTGFSYKFARTPADAGKLVKNIFKGSKGPITIIEIIEQ